MKTALMTGLFSVLLAGSVYAQAIPEAVSVIRQDCSGYSNCYTSLGAWATAKGGIPNGDLITANKIAVARIEGVWTKAEPGQVILGGWKTDAQHYIHIYTTPEARHKGIEGTGYRIHTTDTKQPFNVFVSHLRVEGIEFFSQGETTGSIVSVLPGPNSTPGDVRISHCLVHGKRWTDAQGNLTGSGSGISISSTGTSMIYNNLIYEVAARGWEGGISTGGGINYVYNNTVGSTINGLGIRASDSVGSIAIVKNNLIRAKQKCFMGIMAKGSDFNICHSDFVATYGEGLTTGGSHDIPKATITFLDVAKNDFRLLSTDTVAKDKGLNLAYDENLAFLGDYEGQVRYGQWDIGADEFFNGKIPSDIQAPTAPTGLKLNSIPRSGLVELAWNAANDNVGVSGYRIYRDGVLVKEVATNRWSDDTVLPINKYRYVVSAYDAQFNESAKSNSIEVTTPYLEDTQAPHMVIIRVKVENPNSAVITWTSDEYSTSQVEYGTSTTYGTLTAFDSQLTLNHSVKISGLSPTTYHFRVRSKDAFGNEAVSANQSFTIDLSYVGNTVYVDNKHPQAADAAGQGSESKPFASIQYAYDRARPGDTIIVKPGSYARTNFTTSTTISGGRPGYWITVKAINPPDRSHLPLKTLFDPTKPVATPGNPTLNAVTQGFSFSVGWTRMNPTEYIRVENFEITHIGNADGGIGIGAQTAYGPTQHIDIVGNLIHDTNPTGVYPSGQHAGAGGIKTFSENIHQVYIKNNFIFRSPGTNISINGKNWLVEDNDASRNVSFHTQTGKLTSGDSDAMRFFGSGHIIRNNYFHHINPFEARGHIDCFQTFSATTGNYAFNNLIEGNMCEDLGQMLMSEDQWEDELGHDNRVHHNVFRNNIFWKAEAQSFHFANASDHYTFINNVVAFSAYGSLGIAGNAYNTTVLNNIIYGNGSGTSIMEPNSKIGSVMDHNLHFPDFNWPIKQSEFEQHSFFGKNPLFVNVPKAWIPTDDNGASPTDTGTYDGSSTSIEVNGRHIDQFVVGEILEYCYWGICDGVVRKITSIDGNVISFTPAIVSYKTPECTLETTMTGYNDKDLCAAKISVWGNKAWSPGSVVPPVDFHLREGSPAIGTGTPWAGFTTDKEAKPRPKASAWDMGPYQYSQKIEEPLPGGSGDVSNDGKVTMFDAALVLRYTLGSALSDTQKQKADLNADGKIDGNDVLAIGRKALGL